MKKILFIFVLMLIPVLYSFSQDIEKITFMDIGPDGSKRITRSVNGRFMACMQKKVAQEGNLRAVYESYFFVNKGEWTDWTLDQRSPMRMALNQEYDAGLREFTLLPNIGAILTMGEHNVLQMFAVPNGKTNPIWWNTDGKSYFVFYKLYLIVN